MTNSGLIVRRSVRFEISLPARVRVAAQHMEMLNFAKGVCDENRWIEVDVIDFASGGMGYISPVFFPRGVEVELEIPDFQIEDQPVILNCTMIVKRVAMTDRRPAYQIGCSFIQLDESTADQIEELIDRLSGLAEEENNGDADAGHL